MENTKSEIDLDFVKKDPNYLIVKSGQSIIHKTAEPLYSKIPNWKIKKLIQKPPMVISGPYNPESPGGSYGHAYGVSVSNYPAKKNGRDGDPICDCFRVNTYQNAIIAVIADGCGWGEKPKAAATRVTTNMTKSLSLSLPYIKNTKEAATQIINSLALANYSINYDQKENVGTTTAIGGLCLETNEPTDPNVPKWVFIFVTVGDCKVFKFDASTRFSSDITPGNRCNTDDPRDPGGRLGPYRGKGDPDLRNLDLIYCGLNEEDILILVSDGVHDNLDPMHMGKNPKELDLSYESWDDIPIEEATSAKTEFMNKFFTEIILEKENSTSLKDGGTTEIQITPGLITKKAIRYCRNLTSTSRQWMEQNPNGALVHDYNKYPGKLDHTTCVSIQVGIYIPGKDDIPANSLDSLRWPFI